jgi:hypothetical protein
MAQKSHRHVTSTIQAVEMIQASSFLTASSTTSILPSSFSAMIRSQSLFLPSKKSCFSIDSIEVTEKYDGESVGDEAGIMSPGRGG